VLPEYEVMFGWTGAATGSSKPSPAGARAFGILERTIREGQ
jgi:hypothetical protein